MKILDRKITKNELTENFMTYFKKIIKAAVDVRREIVALDAELHPDLEEILIKNGSKGEDIWGINLRPFESKENFIEYSALINIKPHQNNYSMEIKDDNLRKKIKNIVFKWISYET